MYSLMGMPRDPEMMMLRSATPPPEEQLGNLFKWINYNLNKTEKDNHVWYFVTALWMQKFKHWVKNRPRRSNVLEPGPVDITGLGPLDDIPNNLSQFVPVTENLWGFITKRYGILDDREPVRRRVLGPESGFPGYRTPTIERKLLPMTLYKWDEMGKPHRWKYSLFDNGLSLHKAMRKCFNIPEDVHIRIWMLWDEDSDLWDVYFDDMTRLYQMYRYYKKSSWMHSFKVETFENGCFPLSKPWTFPPRVDLKGIRLAYRYSEPDAPRLPPGFGKVSWIGSDSYWINSVVMLIYIPSICNYFITDMYKRELNPENPLGRKGQFAECVGDIVKTLCFDNDMGVVESFERFRNAIKKSNPMYDNFELVELMQYMQFFLDGLHEDCNRVKEKPKLERPDAGQRPAAEVAAEFWDHFKKSNDSVFLDTFYGLVHNSFRCNACNNTSNRFEATSGITLPMCSRDKTFKIVFRFQDRSKPLLITRVCIASTLSIETVQRKIAKVFGVEPFTFSLMTVCYEGFQDLVKLRDRHPFKQELALDNYLVAVQHPPEWKGGLRCVDRKNNMQLRAVVLMSPWLPHRHFWTLGQFDEITTFTLPYLVMCKATATYEEWMDILEEKFKDIFPRPGREHEWWHWKSPEDDEYDARVKKYSAISVQLYREPPKENTHDMWEKNGRHYHFRLQVDNCTRVNNTDKPLINSSFNHTVHVQPHKLYARKYLEHLMDFKPNVKVVGEWWLTDPALGSFPLEDPLEAWGQEDSENYELRYYCASCKQEEYHTRRTGFWRLPNYLLMNLNRFEVNYHDRHHGGHRIEAMITLPEDGLDLRPYVTGPLAEGEEAMYDLHSFTMHIGNSILEAKYVTWIKYDGHFFRFEGNYFPSYPEEYKKHNGHYFFCYKRRGFEDFTFPKPEGGFVSKPGPLKEETQSRSCLVRGPGGMLMIDDDIFRMEKPSMIVDDHILDAGILKLKTRGFDTKNLESIRSHRKAMKDKDLDGASTSGVTRAPVKCELDSDTDEEMETVMFGAKGKGYSYLGKEKK